MYKDIANMKKGNAAGGSGLPIYLIKHLWENGVDMMHKILKKVWEEEQMPEEWKKSEIVPIYKQSGDPLEYRNYRGIKLLEHGMKMFEKILARRLGKLITVNNMQFGFSPGKGTRCSIYHTITARKTPRSETRIFYLPSYIWKKRMTGCPGIWCIGVWEGEGSQRS